MSLRPLRTIVAQWRPRDLQGGDPLAILRSAWPDLVGATVAQNAQPLELRGDALLVATRSSVWSQQLQFLAPQIIAQLAELGGPKIARLRFRSGAMRAARGVPAPTHTSSRQPAQRALEPLPEAAANERDALDRVRRRIAARVRTATRLCAGCHAPTEGTPYCAPCAGERDARRRTDLERLLFAAPWLEFEALQQLIPGLRHAEIERTRRQLLQRWWVVLERARRSTKEPGSRVRQIASSYVLLQSGFAPEQVTPAVVRNVLGTELEARLFGDRHR